MIKEKNMSYLALYRKYRPTVFEEVIGQDHIVKTLKSQIKNDTIGHAYLFCGTRGVGKTSIAKIFAKAINCTNNTTGSPCLKCPNCIEYSKQSNMDIIEIDAASNNGVDDIRDLKQKIAFPPANGRYRVYIIDEVHMLSSGAFNALLKTLEEPPSYAVFILATTEAYKIPATILSRCTKFDFKLVGISELENLVKKIYKEENIKFTDDAVSAIAKAGEGSVRDTLSIADIVASFSENNVTYNSFLECVGYLSSETIKTLCDAIKNNDICEIISKVKEMNDNGKNLTVLIKDLMEFYRNILVVKTVKNYKEFLKLPEDKINLLVSSAKLYDEKQVLVCMQKLSKLDSGLKYTVNQRLYVESALLDMALSLTNNAFSESNNIDIDAIIEKKVNMMLKSKNFSFAQNNEKPETDLQETKQNEQIEKVAKKQDEAVSEEHRKEKKLENLNKNIEELSTMPQKEKQENTSNAKPERLYSQFLYKLRERNASFLLGALEFASFKQEGDVFYLIADNDMFFETILDFKPLILEIFKELKSDINVEIVQNTAELEKQKKIEMIKSKFGNIKIVD